MNIFEQYGVKEVADVTIYKIDSDNGNIIETPYLFLDTLKVSTLEQTAEQVTANGGKGNAPIMIWDFGKEIELSLEDALYTPRSMAMLWGGQDGWKNESKIINIEIDNPNKDNIVEFTTVGHNNTPEINGINLSGEKNILIKPISFKTEFVSGIIPNEYINNEYIEKAYIYYRNPNYEPMVPDGEEEWLYVRGTISSLAPSTRHYKISYTVKEKILNKKIRNGVIQMCKLITTNQDKYCQDVVIENPTTKEKITIINSTCYTPGGAKFDQDPSLVGAKKFIVYDEHSKHFTNYIFRENSNYWITWEQDIYSNFQKLEIKANDFPGVYKIVGETYARNRKTGKDEYFQFIIPRVKLSSNATLNLEADGDPAVFNLNARVLRPQKGNMIEFVQYQIGDN